jgi:stress response protein SCP2
VRLYNDETNAALYEFDLSEDASRGTAVEMARIYLKDNEWRFTTLGDIIGTSPNGLEDIINKYKS